MKTILKHSETALINLAAFTIELLVGISDTLEHRRNRP